MRRFIGLTAAVLVMPAALLFSEPVQAQYCEGTVYGLSRNYNPATGSGFLAVRSGPKKSARQVGELFNGDKVEIFDRRGNWYKIFALDGSSEGWASAKYIDNDCNY